MRTTQIVSVYFDNAASTSVPINISIPFDVKHINVKGVGILCAVALGRYCYITSDLFENSPIGIFHDDVLKPMNTYNNITYEFKQPRNISGTFQFTLYDMQKNLVPVPAVSAVGIFMEFVSVDE